MFEAARLKANLENKRISFRKTTINGVEQYEMKKQQHDPDTGEETEVTQNVTRDALEFQQDQLKQTIKQQTTSIRQLERERAQTQTSLEGIDTLVAALDAFDAEEAEKEKPKKGRTVPAQG